jgi:hypothetical protein
MVVLTVRQPNADVMIALAHGGLLLSGKKYASQIETRPYGAGFSGFPQTSGHLGYQMPGLRGQQRHWRCCPGTEDFIYGAFFMENTTSY